MNIDQSELSPNIREILTPDQIHRLDKLGIKVEYLEKLVQQKSD